MLFSVQPKVAYRQTYRRKDPQPPFQMSCVQANLTCLSSDPEKCVNFCVNLTLFCSCATINLNDIISYSSPLLQRSFLGRIIQLEPFPGQIQYQPLKTFSWTSMYAHGTEKSPDRKLAPWVDEIWGVFSSDAKGSSSGSPTLFVLLSSGCLPLFLWWNNSRLSVWGEPRYSQRPVCPRSRLTLSYTVTHTLSYTSHSAMQLLYTQSYIRSFLARHNLSFSFYAVERHWQFPASNVS